MFIKLHIIKELDKFIKMIFQYYSFLDLIFKKLEIIKLKNTEKNCWKLEQLGFEPGLSNVKCEALSK